MNLLVIAHFHPSSSIPAYGPQYLLVGEHRLKELDIGQAWVEVSLKIIVIGHGRLASQTCLQKLLLSPERLRAGRPVVRRAGTNHEKS